MALPGQTGTRKEVDIEFHGVSKKFDDVVAVDDVSLSVERGSFFSLLGPSGCGKTTSLRLVAGFEQPTSGDVIIGGENMVGVPAYKRPVNMVFQNYSLFPHLNVADNVAYGLRQRRPQPARQDVLRQVGATLELVRLNGFERRRIWELSGGQQQRVALARALINQPTVLLLDEPLAALDRKLRQEMQIELQTLQRDVGITFVLVTHDQEEALSMSDTICIMRDGHIVQIGGPRELYDEPKNQYVAGFVGKSNFFDGKVVESCPNGAAIQIPNGPLLQGRITHGSSVPRRNGNGRMAVRPELIRIAAPENAVALAADMEVSARVRNCIFLGGQTEYLVETEMLGDILIHTSKQAESLTGGFSPGDAVTVGWDSGAALAFEDTETEQTEDQDRSTVGADLHIQKDGSGKQGD
jgi:spermidine/putrescine transport system ATP-binding protein